MSKNINKDRQYWVDLFIITILFALTRSLIPFLLDYPHAVQDSDSVEYQFIAGHLRDLGQLSISENFNFDNSSLRTPGYPIFIYASWLLFGVKQTSVIIMQVIVSFLALVLWHRISFQQFGRGVALCFSLLLVFNFHLFFYSHTVLTESLFTSLVIVLVAVLLHARETVSRQGNMFLAVLLVSATLIVMGYVRPIAYYMPFIMAVFFIIFPEWMGRTRKKAAAWSCVMLVLCYSGFGVWQYHNKLQYNMWNFTSANYFAPTFVAKMVAEIAYSDEVAAGREPIDLVEERYGKLPPIKDDIKFAMSASINRLMAMLKDHPMAYLQYVMINIPTSIISRASGLSYRYCGIDDCMKKYRYGEKCKDENVFAPCRGLDPSFYENVFDALTLSGDSYSEKYGLSGKDRFVFLFMLYAHLFSLAWIILGIVVVAYIAKIVLKREANSFHYLLLYIAAFLMALPVLSVGGGPWNYRLRLPYEPILVLFASLAIMEIYRKFSSGQPPERHADRG